MSDSVELENAAIAAKAARERLLATTQELQARLDPATLVDEVRTNARASAVDFMESAGEAARRRPGVAAAGAGVLALLVLRRPIGRLFRRAPKETSEHRRR